MQNHLTRMVCDGGCRVSGAVIEELGEGVEGVCCALGFLGC